ncbi:MAG: winged helix-turn-helix transcriptional regulator [Candidatus Thorarchaeota archaeon]|nr:MAG: winged helix-turn-helix transcriptional regulator [Candidatus Thorarchaeota archaeon]
MDSLDREIFYSLYKNCRTPYQDIADQTDVRVSTIWKRADRLCRQDIILRFAVELNPLVIDSVMALLVVRSKGTVDETRLASMIAEVPYVFSSGEIRNRVCYVLLEAPTDEKVSKSASKVMSLDGIEDVENYPLSGLSEDYMDWLRPSIEQLQMKKIHHEVLDCLLVNPRSTAQRIADDLGKNARRVVKALNDLLDSGALWFTVRFHPNVNRGLSVNYKLILDKSKTNQIDLVSALLQEFPKHYFWSFYCRDESILFSYFMFDSFNYVSKIQEQLLEIDGIHSAESTILGSAIKRPRYREVLLRDIVTERKNTLP